MGEVGESGWLLLGVLLLGLLELLTMWGVRLGILVGRILERLLSV